MGRLQKGKGSHQRDEGSPQKDEQSLPLVRESCLMMLGDAVFIDISELQQGT